MPDNDKILKLEFAKGDVLSHDHMTEIVKAINALHRRLAILEDKLKSMNIPSKPLRPNGQSAEDEEWNTKMKPRSYEN